MLIVFLIIGAIVLQWIIRKAVFDGMRDFERWKRKQHIDSDNASTGNQY